MELFYAYEQSSFSAMYVLLKRAETLAVHRAHSDDDLHQKPAFF